MRFNITGGIAAAGGYMQGLDDAEHRDNVREDRAYLRTQREHLQRQQARDDQLRADVAGIKTTREVNANADLPQVDDNGEASAASLPVTKSVPLPLHQQLRQAAEAHKTAGNMEGWLKLTGQADGLQMSDAATKVTQLRASAAGKSTLELANLAKEIFDNDPFPWRISTIQDDGAGGVVAQFQSEEGKVATHPYKTPASILEGMSAIYTPRAWEALQAERQKASIKAQEKAAEEQAKPVTTPAGAVTTFGAGDPRGKTTNNNTLVWNGDYNADGTPTMVRPGAGKGRGGDPDKAISEAWEFVATKGAEKLSPEQLATGARITKQIVVENGGRVPPEVAAEAALAVALDPSKAEPSVDLRTGKILTVFNHPQTGQFVISRLPPPNITPAQMTVAVEKMIGAMPPEEQPIIRKASADPEAARRLIDDIKTKIKTEAEQQAAKATSPQQAEAIRASATATTQATQSSLEAKLALIKKHGKSEPANSGRGFLFPRVGGIPSATKFAPPPDSPAGRALAQRTKAAAETAARDAAQRTERAQLSAQFQRDLSAMAPLDLVRKYDGVRAKLPLADAVRLREVTSQLR